MKVGVGFSSLHGGVNRMVTDLSDVVLHGPVICFLFEVGQKSSIQDG